MRVFDEINSWSAEELLSRLNLPLANDRKTYVCPLCANGTGTTGDGIRPRVNSKGQTRWKCHKCGKDFSNFDLAAAVFGIDADRDTATAAKRLSAEFNLSDDGAFSSSRKPARRRGEGAEPKKEKKSASAQEPKNYAKLYEYCRANAAQFLAERGGSFRGLTAATFEKYGLGVHPEFGAEGQEKRPHLIIPIDDNHFVARAINGHDRSHHGQNAPLYIPEPIDGKFITFIVEGEIDALSVLQVGGKVRVVATGGAQKWRKVVPELEAQFANAAQKPAFIVLFDNDATGVECGKLLVEDLHHAGYEAVSALFADIGQAKVDANDLLRQGEDKLSEKLRRIYVLARDYFADERRQEEQLNKDIELAMQYDAALQAQYEAWRAESEESAQGEDPPVASEEPAKLKTPTQEKQSALERLGIRSSSFAEYFGQDFFSDIELSSRYANRKTGFSNLDAAQNFLPGLYVVGALPAVGKTTFAWQLLNQLALNGENCIYCSYEMSRQELYVKSMTRELYKREPEFCEALNLTSANIRRGALNDSRELRGQAADFAAMTSINLRVFELSNVSIAELIEGLKLVVADSAKSPVIAIDYLQIIPPAKSGKNSSTKEKIDDVILSLKDFQRATNSTLIVISSFNRESYFEKVSFKSFKESGAIEYSADVVWGLENYGVDANDKIDKDEVIKMSNEKVRVVRLSCLKNRNGGLFSCMFRYHAAFDYFEPLKEENERPRYEYKR